MLDEILDYVGLNLDKENKLLNCKKQEFNITKSFDNSMLYRVYKKISISDIDILISMSDRITDIKERFDLAKPINEFIKEDREVFLDIIKQAKIEDIENIEKMQNEFKDKIPYFIKYDKNYLWQIYYSKEKDKYFMLFPAKEGEVSSLFYLIKKKLEKSKEQIYVPICKEEVAEELLSKQEQGDIENYIWYFTKNWPNIYEVEEKNKKILYIIGKTKVKEGFETKYRIRISNKEEAENEYTLLKALFILNTETNYKMIPAINEEGALRLEYENKIIELDDLQKFLYERGIIEKNKRKKLEKQIEDNKNSLEELKQEVNKLNDLYLIQEKQIVTFLNCKKSIFKRLKYYFSKSNKIKGIRFNKINKETNSEYSKKENNDNIDKIDNNINNNFNLSDLVRLCKENMQIEQEYNNTKADVFALKNKKKNIEKKVENAKEYLDEIEKHKKSIFEFWKYTKKDENPSLYEGEENKDNTKLKVYFNLDEDMQEFAEKADLLQKQKLSIEECNSIFSCKYILNSINAVLTNKNEEKVLLEDLEKLKENYFENKKTRIFGDLQEDYTKIKNLNSKKHRENKKNIYSILRINEVTSLEDYKNMVEDIVRLLSEAYKKITAIADFPVYYTENNGEYVIAQIDPKKINIKDLKEKVIYRKDLTRDSNILYFSNIIFYDNLNKTLPNGMDESTEVLIKTEKNESKEVYLNLLEEDGIYNIKINKIIVKKIL